MGLFSKKVLIFSRKHIKNYGDPIIADCCKYLIEKAAKENHIKVNVTIADIFEENPEIMQKNLKGKQIIVFPGGGMNAINVSKIVVKILSLIQDQKRTQVYFNAIGILRTNPKPRNEVLLKKMFNNPQVKQITTRGDLTQLKKYIHTEKPYPPKLVFDPAIWVNEAYQIERNQTSDLIGLGVIRPEIFRLHGNSFSEEDVLQMYCNLIAELENRGYPWKLFTNGSKADYLFGQALLNHLNLCEKTYLGARIKSKQELVQNIADFKAVIAARLHANIIATSLQVPSVGLVWNDKMNQFAKIIGCEDRYIPVDQLLDANHIIDQMELAITEGYHTEQIDEMKSVTMETIKNILT